MNRFAKEGRLVVLALLTAFTLLLSGCFRPAGDTIQPTSDTSNSGVQSLGGPTATAIPVITLLSPDTSMAATATQPEMVITEVTLAPATVAVETEAPTDAGPVTATLQIITPGISLGLLTPDTPIPGPTALPSIGDEGTEEAGINVSVETTDENALVSGDECTYTVEPGDSLYLIAINNDTTVADIQAINEDLEGAEPVLQIGQVIQMPDCEPGATAEADETEEAPETVEDDATPLPGETQTYTVQPGDTLFDIATRFGVTVNAIVRANEMSNPNDLDIGQELIIPAPPES
jgi:LysM repeat protein